MADGSFNTTGAQISGIVEALLAKRALNRPVGFSEELRDIGLTSLDMVNLMLAVEDEFSIEIPQSAMTPENFRSVAAIERLVSLAAVAA
jgi:acyl carrier protein